MHEQHTVAIHGPGGGAGWQSTERCCVYRNPKKRRWCHRGGGPIISARTPQAPCDGVNVYRTFSPFCLLCLNKSTHSDRTIPFRILKTTTEPHPMLYVCVGWRERHPGENETCSALSSIIRAVISASVVLRRGLVGRDRHPPARL